MIDLIQSVITDEISSVNIPYTPIEEIEDLLTTLGFNTDEPGYDDTNGWQHDFWLEYTKDDITYRLSGSWYYGNYTFSKL